MRDGESSPFGERLRQLREAAGLTQEELAERAGLSLNAISALERGQRRRPYLNTVRALAAALGLSDEARAGLIAARTPAGQAGPGSDNEDGHLTQPGAVVAAVASTQVGDAATTGAPPAPGLPTSPVPLVGRETELRELAALLDSGVDGGARLVTLTGPGGVGKTRLAIALIATLAPAFPGGARFLDLTQYDEPALILPAIAELFGLHAGDEPAMLRALAAQLGARRTLLVLDNFEHILAAAPSVAAILATCPTLAILATSRAPLRLRGEREWALAPLTPPDLAAFPQVAAIEGNAAVRLFVGRARAVAPDFALDRRNAAAVAAICRRLDGLPLALELAAARIRLLNPTELLARLDRALPLLAGGARDLPARQRTMRDTIAWSYDLLGEGERALFRALAAFAGGWDLAAAEVVGGPGDAVLDLLGSLVEQSLVLPGTSPGRYRFLEPVREYAREALEGSGEASGARARHAAHFLTLAREAEGAMEGPAQVEWFDRLERDHDNLRAALGWFAERGDTARGLELAYAAWRFWLNRQHHAVGERWLGLFLERAEAAPTPGATPLLVRAHFAYGFLMLRQDKYSPTEHHAQRALALARAVGDVPMQAGALTLLGHRAFRMGDYARARDFYAESLALRRATGERRGIGIAAGGLGRALHALGDLDTARATILEGVSHLAGLGDLTEAGHLYFTLALVARDQGDTTVAKTWLAEAETVHRAVGEELALMRTLLVRGELLAHEGAREAARAALTEALTLAERHDSRATFAAALAGFARLAALAGAYPRALRLAGAAATVRREARPLPYGAHLRPLEEDLAPAWAALGPESGRAVWEAGEALSQADAIAEALAAGDRAGSPG